MKRIYLGMRYLVLPLLLFGYVAHAQLPVLVKVQVRDTKSLNGLPGANIIVTSTLVDKRELLTDSFGRAEFFITDSEMVELFSSAGDYYDSKILLIVPDSAVKHVTLNNVPFDYNKRLLYIGFLEGTDSLQAFGQELIDSLGLMLAKQKSTLILTVEGHSRYYRSHQKSYELSLKRAEKVARMLADRINRKNVVLIPTGVAYSQPVNDCRKNKCREEHMIVNDRVTLKINHIVE